METALAMFRIFHVRNCTVMQQCRYIKSSDDRKVLSGTDRWCKQLSLQILKEADEVVDLLGRLLCACTLVRDIPNIPVFRFMHDSVKSTGVGGCLLNYICAIAGVIQIVLVSRVLDVYVVCLDGIL